MFFRVLSEILYITASGLEPKGVARLHKRDWNWPNKYRHNYDFFFLLFGIFGKFSNLFLNASTSFNFFDMKICHNNFTVWSEEIIVTFTESLDLSNLFFFVVVVQTFKTHIFDTSTSTSTATACSADWILAN